MTVSFKWIVAGLDVAPSEDGLTNVVKVVHWRLSALSSEGPSEEAYGTATLSPGDPASFTPYEDVTYPQAVAWTEEALGAECVERLKSALARQIAERLTPAVVSRPVPWSDPSLPD